MDEALELNAACLVLVVGGLPGSSKDLPGARLQVRDGLAVDVYHTWWDPTLFRQIERAGKKRLLAFHICDWLVPTRDMLQDRGMMGDGVIDIRRMRQAVEAQGYRGLHEVEIFSEKNWWQRDPDEVMETCKERHRRHC